MPTQENNNQSSPFEIVTTKKSKKIGKTGLIVAILISVFLVLSVVAGILLVRQQQNVQEKAASATCPAAEACPYASQPNLIRSCHPGDADGTVSESLCNQAGRVATCGAATTKYCCPSVGAAWTTDMTVCNGLAASPTPTPDTQVDNNNCGTAGNVCGAGTTCFAGACTFATPTPTATVTPTPTATAGAQNSCNGTCGSNSNCQSGLYCYSGSCRNPLCSSDATCGCGASPTPTPTATSSTTTTTTTTSAQTTPLPIPVTGTDWPTIVGIGVGAVTIIGSIIIAL